MKTVNINCAEVATMAGLTLEKDYYNDTEDDSGFIVSRFGDEITVKAIDDRYSEQSVSLLPVDFTVLDALNEAAEDAKKFKKARSEWSRLKLNDVSAANYVGRLSEVVYAFSESRDTYLVKLELAGDTRYCAIFEEIKNGIKSVGKRVVHTSKSQDLTMTVEAAELEFKAFLLRMRGLEND